MSREEQLVPRTSVPTILDRLAPPPQTGGRTGSSRFRSEEEELSASITRDLHILLNTRREEFLVPPEFEQTATSIFNFGIPDFTKCGSLRSTAEQGRLCKWIEEAIRIFEPRLRNISVRVLDSENVTSVLRFRVEAKADLIADRMSFDMGLKRDTGELAVSES
jgi:type VI secretion system lysozyme-like protein